MDRRQSKKLLPSQTYLWECLRKHSGIEVRLKVRKWATRTETYVGYYLHTPLGDFGLNKDISPISPFHLRQQKSQLPSIKKVQAKRYKMVFDEQTLHGISNNTSHVKSISFELEGLKEVFSKSEHMSRIYIAILGRGSCSNTLGHVGDFILKPAEVMEYTRLWERDRDNLLAKKGREAKRRLKASIPES